MQDNSTGLARCAPVPPLMVSTALRIGLSPRHGAK